MKPENCIPKDKFDVAAVRRAKIVGFPALNPIIPDLLVWLQDANWPVAPEVAELLLMAGPEIIPRIKRILRSTDEMWKYWTILLLIEKSDQEIWNCLYEDILRLAENPGFSEIKEGVAKVARLALDRRGT